MVTSEADAVWEGDLATGGGQVSTASGAVREAAIGWKKRAEERDGTSPEELIAAAHAACFSMAFAARLAKNKTPPTRLGVHATVTFDKVDGGFKIVSSVLAVSGSVPDLALADFQRIAEEAKDGCPVSMALKGNVALSVVATLTEQ